MSMKTTKNKINIFLRKRIVRVFTIPAALLLMWAILTLWYMVSYDNSFLILSHTHSIENFTNAPNERLEKGKKITGSFVAPENNLGIVSIRFGKYVRIPYKDEDTLVFRIRRSGQDKWYYENRYRSGTMYDVPLFPFGFPVINDSKNKKYEFELISLNGNNKNGLKVSQRQPILVSKYQIPKSLLNSDKKEFALLLGKKIYTSFKIVDIWFSSLMYILPLFLYLIHISRFKKRIFYYGMGFDNIILLFLLMPALFDTVFLQSSDDLLYIIYIVIWLIIVKIQKQTSKYSYLFGLIFLIITPWFLLRNNAAVALKATSWAYMFLVAGTIQILIESKLRKKKYEKS